MIYILAGLILWSGVHFWKRIAPKERAKFGDKGKGIVALGSVAGIVLMVIGYKVADGTLYWGRSPAMTGINNLLMLFAFYLFAASGAKTRVTRAIRHPQLTAVVVWSVAHILVNGDSPSFLLFGGMAAWAIAEMLVINRAEGQRGPYHEVPIKKEITAVIATVVVFLVVATIHILLGYNPFG
ncbi:NnrU family protein [Loktanella sp. F6476L]|uniref:NnrU family protein n=1 Tax=Loktanella sp. F6476L TaxID=2926405 RepID=UPI001FF1BC63|nr:NnrU family protein [Loktanella sp. F6476L]MCK0120229.1 NnrU family protein [Loktanella sp. F6476L]